MRTALLMLSILSFQLAHAADPVFSPALSAAITNSIPERDWRRLGRNPTSAELSEFLADHHSTRATKSKTLSSAASEALTTVYDGAYFPDSNLQFNYSYPHNNCVQYNSLMDPALCDPIATTLGNSTGWEYTDYYTDNGSDQNFATGAISTVSFVLIGTYEIPAVYFRHCHVTYIVNPFWSNVFETTFPAGFTILACYDTYSTRQVYDATIAPRFAYSTPPGLPSRVLAFNPTYPGTPGPVPTPGTSPSPSPCPSISPSPTPSPIPSQTPTTPHALRVTFIKDNDADPVVNGTTTTASIEPSFNSCGELPSRTALRSFKVECINPTSGVVVSGCQITADLALGIEDGGHEHDFDSRPLGVIYPQVATTELISIPQEGAEMSYESPEVSGDVNVALTGIGPDGRNLSPAYVYFTVKTVGFFGPLANDGLYFAVGSHSSGDKGTTRLKDKLLELVTTFDDIVSEIITTPKLQSQGASLPLGGLLDIEKNWAPPHCEHRNGDIVDISFSSFKSYDPTTKAFLHDALANAFNKVGFKAPIHNGNHWHAKLK